MNGLKIVTIGGGSSYTPELVEGFIKRYEILPVRELWLVDIEEGREKLEIVGGLAERMVKKAGVPMKVILSCDRREALKDADFVTTQMRVGQLEARIQDERIPLKHGMIGQETNGAGGMFKAFRTIPVILEIVKDMKELCPHAWMINFTNPAGMITEAVLRYTDFKKVIGLCPDRIRMEIAGVNHHIFATDIFLDGESVLEQVIRRYQNLDTSDTIAMKNFNAFPFSAGLLNGLGCIPCPYHNYYFFTEKQLRQELEEYEEGRVRGEVVRKLESELFALYRDENLDEKPKQLEQRGGARYSDAACNLICSIYNNTCDIQYVNVRNQGAVSNLPADSAVEIASVITKDGPKPIAVGELKPQINGMIQMIKSFERMVCEAAVTGNRDLAVAALNINPLCPSDELANITVDELIRAHKKYLPQFADRI